MASISVLTIKVRIAFVVRILMKLERETPDQEYSDDYLEQRRRAALARIDRLSKSVDDLIDQAMQQGAPDREWWNW